MRPTIQFSLIQGLFWGSFASVFAFSSVYLLAKGFTNTEVGYVIAAGSAVSALLQPMVGEMADRSKKLILHNLIIGFSAVMIALSMMLLGFGNGLPLIALLYGLLVVFLQVITPLTYSLGMFFKEKGVNINFGLCRGIGSITYAFVASALGVIAERAGEDTVIISVLVIYLLLIVVVLFFHFPGVSEIKDSS